jgi:hypothetical protein
MVVHICNSSYWDKGQRQKDDSSMPVGTKVTTRQYPEKKKTKTKKGGGRWLGV